ncbi:MAG: ABC transporter permease [Planctomycetes bacterium]|nr:ABC transporter permease [Planctomycetota bacterium]
MVIWTLAKKDLRLLVRDARALIILLAMPLIFILVLGVSLGENFGQKPADRLKVTVVNLDDGFKSDPREPIRQGVGLFALVPNPAAGPWQAVVGASMTSPRPSWADTLLHDINETADIRVEYVQTRAEAERLVKTSKRAAVLIIGKDFSNRVERCSFLTEGINPYHRDGVKIGTLDVEILEDKTQPTAVAIIHQVAQGSLLRVVMPWMIGRAFEKIGDPAFLELLGKEKELPGSVRFFLTGPLTSAAEKKKLGVGLQNSLQNIFPRYNLTAANWAALTKEKASLSTKSDQNTHFKEDGIGLLKRGGTRYQLLVPAYIVMFAFFLVLTVGWLFVAERRQGTLKRLVVAPLTKVDILIGKMLPCLFLSLFQGFFLFGAGKLLFGMSWGAEPIWLLVVIPATSFAAIGLAMLVAALARTESQVSIYGSLLVLVLAIVSGCLMGDPGLWDNERMQMISRLTPHAWALEAYKQLLTNPEPEIAIVLQACGVLTGFGAGLLALAWWCLRLDADG